MVDPLSYFSFQPALHDWCIKDRGMCYPVCGMMHIKEPLHLIGKSSQCGGSGFPQWVILGDKLVSAGLQMPVGPRPMAYYAYW